MKLSDITDKTPLVKEFAKQLGKKEQVVAVVIHKAKRVAGVSAVACDFNLENGQQVTAYMRISGDKPDIFRLELNGKVISGHWDFDISYKPSFNQSVKEVYQEVVANKAKFDKEQTRQKVVNPNTKKSVAPKENLDDVLTALENEITTKEQTAKQLEQRLSELM